MGATASSQSAFGGDEGSDPRGAYLAMMGVAGGGEGGVFEGGRSSKEDALADLKTYRSSRAAEVKEKLVKAVVQVLKDLGVRADSDNIHDLVKHIPDPNKKNFGEDAKVHSKICTELAKAINGAIGAVIDMRDPPEVICRRVHNLVDSFSHGMQWEFLHVYSNVEQALHDIQTLFAVMQSTYRNFLKQIKKEELGFDASKFNEMYQKAEKEFELRIQVLNGLLKTDVLPAKEELDTALKYQKADNQVLRDLGLKPGSKQLSDQIAFAISKTGTMAAITDKVHRALKKVGLNIEEFTSLKNMHELDNKIEDLHENLLRKNKGKKSRTVFNEFQDSVEKLRRWFGKMKTDKNYALGAAEGGARGEFKKRLASEARAEKLLRQIQLQNRSRLLFIRQFVKGLYTRYDAVLKAVNDFGPRIGREIPVGPKMEELMDAFRRMAVRNLRVKNMDQALLGLQSDVRAREIRDSFIASLKLITRKLDDVAQAGDYNRAISYFNAIKTAIDDIITYINRYNETRRLKFGGGHETYRPKIGGEHENVVNDIFNEIKDKSLNEAVAFAREEIRKIGESREEINLLKKYAYNIYIEFIAVLTRVPYNLTPDTVTLASLNQRFVNDLFMHTLATHITNFTNDLEDGTIDNTYKDLFDIYLKIFWDNVAYLVSHHRRNDMQVLYREHEAQFRRYTTIKGDLGARGDIATDTVHKERGIISKALAVLHLAVQDHGDPSNISKPDIATPISRGNNSTILLTPLIATAPAMEKKDIGNTPKPKVGPKSAALSAELKYAPPMSYFDPLRLKSSDIGPADDEAIKFTAIPPRRFRASYPVDFRFLPPGAEDQAIPRPRDAFYGDPKYNVVDGEYALEGVGEEEFVDAEEAPPLDPGAGPGAGPGAEEAVGEAAGPGAGPGAEEAVGEAAEEAADRGVFGRMGEAIGVLRPLRRPEEAAAEEKKDERGEDVFAGGDYSDDMIGTRSENYRIDIDDYALKDSVKLEEAIGKMMYFYYVAGVRDNLKRTSTELKGYSEQYETVLSSAMAIRKAELKKEWDEKIEQLENDYEFLFNFEYSDGVNKKKMKGMSADQYEYLKEMINTMYDAKIKLYKAVEAIELYLKDYTRVVANNPDVIKDLKKVLEHNNNIFNWFNNEAGDGLANVFDMAPVSIGDADAIDLTPEFQLNDVMEDIKHVIKHLKTSGDDEPHYYRRLLALNALRNDDKIVNNILTKSSLKELGMSDEEITTGGNKNKVKDVLFFGDLRLPLYKQRDVDRLGDAISSALSNFQALQNIMNTFIMVANITNHEGNKQLMPPRQIYKMLLDYLVASTVVMGCSASVGTYTEGGTGTGSFAPTLARPYENDDSDVTKKDKTLANMQDLHIKSAEDPRYNLHVFPPEIHNAIKQFGTANNIDIEFRRKRGEFDKETDTYNGEELTSMIRKHYSDYLVFFANATESPRFKHTNGTMFKMDNLYFSYALKAMVGKIMVTIGLYDLLQRDNVVPMESIQQNDVRLILGGDIEDDRPPTANPECAELYYRVPRLVELYRKELKTDDNADVSVTMMVDVEMKYADLFSLMFDELEYDVVSTGAYSTRDCWRIIRIINQMYDESKDVQTVLDNIYKEVNRRYCIVKKDELTRSQRLKQWRRRTTIDNIQEKFSDNQIDILPDDGGIGEFATVPSDHYVLPENLRSRRDISTEKRTMYMLDSGAPSEDSQYQMIQTFRDKMAKLFKGCDFARYTRNVYKNIIDQTRREMQRVNTPEQRLALAVGLISTDSKMTSLDARKLMMFHETVVYGLNVLNGISSTIVAFCDFVELTSYGKFRDAVMEYLDKNVDVNTINWRSRTRAGYTAGDPAHRVNSQYPFVQNGGDDANRRYRATVFKNMPHFLENYCMDATDTYNSRGGIDPRITHCEMLAVICDWYRSLENSDADNGKQNPKNKKIFVDLMWRFTFRNQDLMRDILLNLSNFGYDTQGLVKIEFSRTDNKVNINYGNLRDTIKELLTDVRAFLEIFRGHLSDAIIAEYEHGYPNQISLTHSDTPKVGTLYYLEQILFDGYFRDENVDYEYRTEDQIELKEKPTFARNNRWLNETINALTREHKDDNLCNITYFKQARRRPYAFIGRDMDISEDGYVAAVHGASMNDIKTEHDRTFVPFADPADEGVRIVDANGEKNLDTAFDQLCKRDEYGQTVAEILFYNILKPGSGLDDGEATGEAIILDPLNLSEFVDESTMAAIGMPVDRSLRATDNLDHLLWKRVVIDTKIGEPSAEKMKEYSNMSGQEDDPRHSLRFPYFTHISEFYKVDGTLGGADSLFFLFNQYVIHFIRTLFDRTNNKIYAQLVRSFISGPLSSFVSKALTNGATNLYPDLFTPTNDYTRLNAFYQRFDIENNVSLLHSVAVVLRNLTQTKSIDGHAFLIQNSADLPGYSKDNMKGNLPIFMRMFGYISRFGNMLKDAIMGMDLNVSRYEVKSLLKYSTFENTLRPMSSVDNYNDMLSFKDYGRTNRTCILGKTPCAFKRDAQILTEIASWSAQKNPSAQLYSSDDALGYYTSFINNLLSAADSVQNSCREVLRELVDEHVYMELSDGYISNYKAKSGGRLPIMPLSSSLYQLREIVTRTNGDIVANEQERLLPTNAISDTRFRYMYATRAVFLYNDKIELSRYPYVSQMLKQYNELVSEGDKVSDNKYIGFLERTIGLTRYLTGFTFFRGRYGVLARRKYDRNAPIRKIRIYDQMDIGTSMKRTPAANKSKLLVFQLQGSKSLTQERVLEISESVDQRRTLEQITAEITIKDTDIEDDREKELKYNIIDMNIVPFNPSGFMRDIPLTNIYNYCYTMESMVANMFGKDSADIRNIKLDTASIKAQITAKGVDGLPNVKEVFLKLLFNPYAKVSDAYVMGLGLRNGEAGASPYDIDILAPLQRIFRGDNSLNLGTPKFLSDQLFNKVLFQSIYPRSMGAFDAEGGPIYSLGRLMNPGDRMRVQDAKFILEPSGQMEYRTVFGQEPTNRGYPATADGQPHTDDRDAGTYYLTYPYRKKDDNKKRKEFRIVQIPVTGKDFSRLMQLTMDRFDTNIVRNLFFITNLYRVLRLKLNQELVQNHSMIISTDNLVTPSITEYGASPNQGHTEVFDDNEIDRNYPSYTSRRKSLYRH